MKLNMTETHMPESEFQRLMLFVKDADPVSFPHSYGIMYITRDGKLVGAKVLDDYFQWHYYLY